MFFITGNHEYYSGAPEWLAHLRTLGIRTLENERVTVAEHHTGRVNPQLTAVTPPIAGRGECVLVSA